MRIRAGQIAVRGLAIVMHVRMFVCEEFMSMLVPEATAKPAQV